MERLQYTIDYHRHIDVAACFPLHLQTSTLFDALWLVIEREQHVFHTIDVFVGIPSLAKRIKEYEQDDWPGLNVANVLSELCAQDIIWNHGAAIENWWQRLQNLNV